MEVLRAEAATKRFGTVVALADVSVTVQRGECLALVGESGSGKTTLLRCFNGLVTPDEGRVLVEERDVAAMEPVALRRRIGYVPQDGGLLPHWRVQRNVELETRLIDDLLDMTRAARGTLSVDRELLDLHRVLRDTVELCEADRPPGIAITWAA